MTSVVGGHICDFRSPKPLSEDTLQDVGLNFEYGEYFGGFELLQNIIATGASIGTGEPSNNPAFCPTPAHLNLAATAAIHPRWTSRAESRDARDVADEAFRVLQYTLQTVGPAGFAGAFKFAKTKPRNRYQSKHSDESADSENEIVSSYAKERSLFAQVDSFWQLVGWAFNTARNFPDRWERWHLLLSFWLDLLDEDVDRQIKLCESGEPQSTHGPAWTLLRCDEGSRHARRRILRAIMADGSSKAMAEFPEVFKNETKPKQKQSIALKKEVVNIEENRWADYDDNEEDVVMEDAAPVTSNNPCDMDAPPLRVRFVSTLLHFSTIPDNPLAELEELLDVLTECIRALPLDDFRQILRGLKVPIDIRIALFANTLLPFLPSIPKKIDILNIDEATIRKHFLAYAANTANVMDQVKMNLLVEYLIVDMIDDKRLTYSYNLMEMTKKGMHARLTQLSFYAKKGVKGESKRLDDNARDELLRSQERVIVYLELLQG
ncbi:hypothetical protein BT63DRAFT_39611 [Microthyrium microscopicum]|uniref:Uncharacterized protein n=1 Tax=Microthyrium microscopicum TaxID=703497 RepID=A0A6A6UUI5_9PEZI|nr:hypothetical protein BT63DRAFT_39611 [Microthyrium microscopicum]